MRDYTQLLKNPEIENDPQRFYFNEIMEKAFDPNHDDLADMQNFQYALILALEAVQKYTNDWIKHIHDNYDSQVQGLRDEIDRLNPDI